MRSTLSALAAVLIVSTAMAANFEARSEHYAVAVTSTDLAAKVVVTDLASNAAVLTEDVPWGDDHPPAIIRDIDDLRYMLRLVRHPNYVNVTLEVERGEMEIDLVRGEWSRGPRQAHVAARGALPVGGKVKAPIVVYRVEPMFTEQARKDRISGVVILETRVDETGHVSDIMALKPLPDGLTEAALDAVKQWVFEPGTVDGKAVPVIFNLTVNFKLDTPARVPPPTP